MGRRDGNGGLRRARGEVRSRAGAIRGEVSTLLEKLAESGLIVQTEDAAGGLAVADAGDGVKGPLEPARLERYTDTKGYFLAGMEIAAEDYAPR